MRIAFDGVSLLIGLMGVALGAWSLFTQNNVPLTVLALAISLICFGALAAALLSAVELNKMQRRGRRASLWASALPKVSQSILELANSVAPEGSDSGVELKRQFQAHATNACHALANAYSQVAGRECRVTLVETWFPARGGDAAVKRLASSGGHDPAQTTDWVSENSDFAEIFDGADYFFSNDLPAELGQGYRNSHWTRARLQEMKRTGKYPYQATIVWPVQAFVELDGEPTKHTVGFLCVDSKEPKVFDDTIDVTVGELIARAFYAVWPKASLELVSETDQKGSP